MTPTPRELSAGGRTSPRRFVRHHSSALLALALLVAMIVLYVVLYVAGTGYTPGTFELTSITNNAMPLVMAAVGQTIVVVTGGIDLSVGGMIDLTNGIAAVDMHDDPVSIATWSVIVLGVGALGGLANGLLIAIGRLQPILVTIATLSVFQGIAIRVLPQPGGKVPGGLTSVLTSRDQPSALVFIALAGLLWLLLRRTGLGVSLFAIGNDEHAARALGVRVVAAKVAAYVLSGVFAAAAGLFLAATSTSGDATSGNVYTLTSIAATVLGGVSFFGGRGSALGSIAGALTLSILVGILFFAHINPLYQTFYQGLFLILAVVAAGLLALALRRRRVGG